MWPDRRWQELVRPVMQSLAHSVVVLSRQGPTGGGFEISSSTAEIHWPRCQYSVGNSRLRVFLVVRLSPSSTCLIGSHRRAQWQAAQCG